MDFDLRWLLFALPVAFGLGWLASKLDARQWKREQRDAPKAYFKGLNLLLNEQQDKAIDAFIEAVQNDPDTSELHFALGNLFRRRGEYERAVRVHQHLLQRGDLPRAERDRAQHALAQDFFKAGLFDRAEEAFAALRGTAFETEAELALLSLYERSREWRKAAEVARHLEQGGTGSFAARIANYLCEQALEAQARNEHGEAQELLAQARKTAPQAARAHVLAGQMLARRGQPEQAMAAYAQLLSAKPEAFNLVAGDYADAALAIGATEPALATLLAQYQRAPGMHLLLAIAKLEPAAAAQRQRLVTHLRAEPSLSAARMLLTQSKAQLSEEEAPLMAAALDRASRPLQRYRCAACGFEAQHYFWQCPGCLNWDTYPPRHVEEL
ncbi:lipopolysaccharide assembly protein LapB [Paucibacter sp. O1-1]|uniref:lipopolysaccharide assembly protein LapB n=1 Tax=Paucibacter sp. XJ19-41 TaxID=2927824 RepID=UPI0021D49A11|nr:lipopolysaccharide assembly protein LapB [Paucibacter sp. XJ19-41]MCU7372783.1 lipopolysaccharide assembly protein LapB [Paucibacter sp. O1-1]MDA3827778.1 lipopolysaccharide assembly protein LapB [Paucibacter sp. O1-1]MDC6169178.1 lipopolysaccharide assembly protein LapB [Paucibacter sp. XJ19-41]